MNGICLIQVVYDCFLSLTQVLQIFELAKLLVWETKVQWNFQWCVCLCVCDIKPELSWENIVIDIVIDKISPG